jgi:putative SOS response-associated peptidase YedK
MMTGSPRYNIAPTQHVPVIRQHPKEPIRQPFDDEMGVDPIFGKVARRRGRND